MFHFPKYIKIISGGQTGVDRAALDFAIHHNIPCGGWCPKGRLAEDGIIPYKYLLKETSTKAYKERTEKNILDSDVTLIIYTGKIDIGSKLTDDLCIKYNKPKLLIDLDDNTQDLNITDWLLNYQINVLNIAGPRESNSPGIYKHTLIFLNQIFKNIED